MKAIIRIAVTSVYKLLVIGAIVQSVGVLAGNLVIQQELWAVTVLCLLLSRASYHLLTKEGKQ